MIGWIKEKFIGNNLEKLIIYLKNYIFKYNYYINIYYYLCYS
jgi:hypothetical protein